MIPRLPRLPQLAFGVVLLASGGLAAQGLTSSLDFSQRQLEAAFLQAEGYSAADCQATAHGFTCGGDFGDSYERPAVLHVDVTGDGATEAMVTAQSWPLNDGISVNASSQSSRILTVSAGRLREVPLRPRCEGAMSAHEGGATCIRAIWDSDDPRYSRAAGPAYELRQAYRYDAGSGSLKPAGAASRRELLKACGDELIRIEDRCGD